MAEDNARFSLRTMMDDVAAWGRAGYPGTATGRYQDAAHEIERLRREVARLESRLREEETRYATGLEAWRANNLYHQRLIAELQRNSDRYLHLRNQKGMPTPEEFDRMVDADMALAKSGRTL